MIKGKCIIKKCKNRYAMVTRNGKRILAHRFLYEQKYGKIKEGMVIDHLCKTTRCINTEHMEVVTQAENTRRGKSAKLNYELVEQIRNMYKNIKITQAELGRIFSVQRTTVHRVVNYRRWL